MAVLDDTFTLPNGVRIPALGFGTWQIPEGAEAYGAVRCALECGYRHVDTALAYGNEASVGRAVRDSGLDRSRVFVTSKLPAEVKTAAGAREAIERTLGALGPEPLDLYLIHAPWPWSEIGKDCRAGNREVWKVIEDAHAAGRLRAIGVSNFDADDLADLVAGCRVPPMVDQVRCFVGDTQEPVLRACRERGILVEGYSPLATGRLVANEAIAEVARKHGVSVPQVCVRYVLQRGILPLPKATRPEHIRANAAVDFTLDAADMAYLGGLRDTVPRRG